MSGRKALWGIGVSASFTILTWVAPDNWFSDQSRQQIAMVAAVGILLFGVLWLLECDWASRLRSRPKVMRPMVLLLVFLVGGTTSVLFWKFLPIPTPSVTIDNIEEVVFSWLSSSGYKVTPIPPSNLIYFGLRMEANGREFSVVRFKDPQLSGMLTFRAGMPRAAEYRSKLVTLMPSETDIILSEARTAVVAQGVGIEGLVMPLTGVTFTHHIEINKDLTRFSFLQAASHFDGAAFLANSKILSGIASAERNASMRAKYSSQQVIEVMTPPIKEPFHTNTSLNLDNVATLDWFGAATPDRVQLVLSASPLNTLDEPTPGSRLQSGGAGIIVGGGTQTRQAAVGSFTDRYIFETSGPKMAHVVVIRDRKFRVTLQRVRQRADPRAHLLVYTFGISEE